MNLLNENDWKQFSDAFGQKRAVTLVRTMGDLEIVVESCVPPPVWGSAMVVGLTIRKRGRTIVHQWFDDINTAKASVEQYAKR